MRLTALALALAAVVCVSPCAHAQGAANRDSNVPSEESCRADVSKFEQAIGFVRQNQGNQAAADLKEKLLPAKIERDLLFSQGYCGLAKYLHEKKLIK